MTVKIMFFRKQRKLEKAKRIVEAYDDMDGDVAEPIVTEGELTDIPQHYIVGDVNTDDRIDGRDLTALLKYLADWDITFGKTENDTPAK